MDADCQEETFRLRTDLNYNTVYDGFNRRKKCQRLKCFCMFTIIAVLTSVVICLVVILLLLKARLDGVQTRSEDLKVKFDDAVSRASDFTKYGNNDKPEAMELAATDLVKGAARVVGRSGVSSGLTSIVGSGINLLKGSSSNTKNAQNHRSPPINDDMNQSKISTLPDKISTLEYLRLRQRENQQEKQRFSDKFDHIADSNVYFDIGYVKDLKLNCIDTESKTTFPNIDYALFGYDVYKGFPLTNGHDPGFTYPIFNADYMSGGQTSDCRYIVPHGLVSVTDVSCSTSLSTAAFRNVMELEHGITNYAKTGGGFAGFQARASLEYRRAWTLLTTGEYVYVLSTAKCNYYLSKMNSDDPPPFSSSFQKWVQRLNSSDDTDTYVLFLSKFGTHFIKEMSFGARYSLQKTVQKQDFDLQVVGEIDISTETSAGSFFDIGQKVGKEHVSAAMRQKLQSSTNIISVGIPPPVDSSDEIWTLKVHENPMPLAYTLEPIEKLFIPERMEGFENDLLRITQNIAGAKKMYYNKLMSEELKGEYVSSGRWVTKTLTASNGGYNGQWFPPEFCPRGYFAVGYKLKIEHFQKNTDNTALNGVQLLCCNKSGKMINKGIQSGTGHRGLWTVVAMCPKTHDDLQTLFLQQYRQYHRKMENKDDTSLNFVKFECNDMSSSMASVPLAVSSSTASSLFGSSSEICPQGSAVCGIQTRVDEFIANSDNTGLNDIRLMCCEDDS